MGLQKYGSPEPIEPEASEQQKTAARTEANEINRERLLRDVVREDEAENR